HNAVEYSLGSDAFSVSRVRWPVSINRQAVNQLLWPPARDATLRQCSRTVGMSAAPKHHASNDSESRTLQFENESCSAGLERMSPATLDFLFPQRRLVGNINAQVFQDAHDKSRIVIDTTPQREKVPLAQADSRVFVAVSALVWAFKPRVVSAVAVLFGHRSHDLLIEVTIPSAECARMKYNANLR